MSTIKLGVLPSFSGVGGCHGDEIAWAAHLACDEVNAEGGIREQPLELVVADDGSDPEQAVFAAERLISTGCRALVGGLLARVRLALVHRIAEPRRVPLLCFAPMESRSMGRHCFHFGALPNQQIARMVARMCEQHGRRVFVAACDDEWGHGALAASKHALAGHGGELVGWRFVPVGMLDSSGRALGELIDAIEAAAPDLLLSYFVGRDQLALLRRAETRGLTRSLTIVADHFDERLASLLTPAQRQGIHACNGYFMSVDSRENARLLAELRRCEESSRGSGILSHIGEAAYVCVKAFALAAARADVYERALGHGLEYTDMLAPRGHVRLGHDAQHAAVGTLLARCGADGRFTILDTFAPSHAQLGSPCSTPSASAAASSRPEEGLLARLSVAIVLVRASDGVVVLANPAAQRLLGCEAAPLGHVLVNPAAHEGLPSLAPEGLQPAFEHAERWRSDTALLRADGTRTLVEIEGSTFAHPRHGVVWCLECRDVGSQREAEADMRKRANRYRRAEIASDEGLWEWDVLGSESHVAPRWLELLGHAPDEQPPSVAAFFERMHPDDRGLVHTIQERPAGTTFDVELRVRHREGEYRWYRSRGVVTLDDGIRRVTGSLSDIGARKRMEQRWQLAEQLAGLGAWERDFSSDTIWWSDVQRRINGVQPEAALSQDFFLSLVHPDDRDAFDRAYRDVLARGLSDTTYRIVRPDGGVRHVHGIAMLESDIEGRPLRMFGTNQDITEAVEAARKQQNTIAEKEALLREIHHRVRNNLAVVSSLMHFHAQRLESERDAETIARLCRRIKAMSLAHDQVQRGAMFGSVRLADYVAELAFQLRNEHATDALVTIDAEDISLPIEVAMPLGQILSELLANALTFGSVPRPGRVRLTLRWCECNVEILIEDAGPGFPADFDPERGSGFGWLLIRMLTKQIGGRVTVESREGARVRIVVPCGDQDGKRR